MIPKIIHYCWLSNDPLPSSFEANLNGWRKIMPDYEFMLWNFDRFDIHSSEWVKEAFEMKKYAFAADYIRLYALYKYGGVYLDLDVEVVKKLDDLLKKKVILGFESDNRAIEAGILGGEQKSSWLLDCLKYYEGKNFVKPDGTFENTPLPYILYKIIESKHPAIMPLVLPFDFLTAKDLSTLKVVKTENTYTIHHFAGSWTSPLSCFRRKVKVFIGPRFTSWIVRLKRSFLI